MNLGDDRFKEMTPKRYQPALGLRPGGERPDLEPLIALQFAAMYASIATHSRLGINVVAEAGHHDDYSVPRRILPKCARTMQGLPVLFVGVRCPLEVVLERRRATWGTGYQADGSVPAPVLRWQQAVHQPGIYDLEVDTSVHSPRACAAQIEARLGQGAAADAFARLAALPAD